MEIQQIKAFLAVAEELHFGRAAARLHIAQPPLSRMIQQLEKQFGTALFNRNTRTVRLTSAGEALVSPAREILDACRMAEIAVSAAGKGHTGRVRLGFSGVGAYLLVGKWARVVRETNPGIEFVLFSSAFATEALRRVVDGSLDVAMVRWLFQPDGICSRVIAHDTVVVAFPKNHKFAGRPSITMDELRDEDFVALPGEPGSRLRDLLVSHARECGFSPRIVQSVPDSLSMLTAVGAGVGCAVTIDAVAQNIKAPDVSFLPLSSIPEPLELRLAWREDNDSAALHEILRLAEEALPTPT